MLKHSKFTIVYLLIIIILISSIEVSSYPTRRKRGVGFSPPPNLEYAIAQDCIEPSQIEGVAQISQNFEEILINMTDPFIIKLLQEAQDSGIGDRPYYNETHYIHRTGYISRRIWDNGTHFWTIDAYLIQKVKFGPINLNVHNCANYASELERELTNLGYDATFTVDETGNKYPAHAAVDVHTPNGKLIFIEPQFAEYGDGRIFYNADHNNDGQITAHVNQQYMLNQATESAHGVWVYDNDVAARVYGVPLPTLPY